MNRLSHSRSLRGILLWTLGIVYLASFVIIATALAGVIYHDQVTVWRERHAEAATVSARTLTMFLDRARQMLTTVGELDSGEDPDMAKAIERVLLSDTSRTVLEVVQVDGQGRVVGSAYRAASVLTDVFAVRQSNWFHVAHGGETYLGPIQISPSGVPYTVMAIPDRDGGVVAARLDMRILWDLVGDMHFGKTGNIYILNQHGRMLAHDEPAFVLANTSLGRRPEFLAFLQAQASQPHATWSDTYENFQGNRVLGMFTGLPGTNWVVVTEILASEIYGASLRAVLVLAAGMLLLGLLRDADHDAHPQSGAVQTVGAGAAEVPSRSAKVTSTMLSNSTCRMKLASWPHHLTRWRRTCVHATAKLRRTRQPWQKHMSAPWQHRASSRNSLPR